MNLDRILRGTAITITTLSLLSEAYVGLRIYQGFPARALISEDYRSINPTDEQTAFSLGLVGLFGTGLLSFLSKDYSLRKAK